VTEFTDHGTRVLLVDLPDHVVLHRDHDGDHTLRMGIRVRDRQTRALYTVEFDFPTLDDWDDYQTECAKFFGMIGSDFPDIALPDDVRAAIESGDYKLWAAVVSSAFRVKVFRDLVRNILFRYLDPYVIGLQPAGEAHDPDRHRAWVSRNLNMNQCVHAFAMVLAIDDSLKKNGRAALERIFHLVTSPRSSASLPARQGRGSRASGAGLTPLRESGLSGSRKERKPSPSGLNPVGSNRLN
jgi:hypothetical protein